ncbi:hypothetical protein DDZ18_08860 [Marinicauda salina]|uniref:Uncharacterized protein n=2 Tax=Marinicauda salina TaxID=2135793 RepID=A0A2U2BUW5_9PROT|nr:hypothetical protein DDZ18_08860 [Marinicauda salina]
MMWGEQLANEGFPIEAIQDPIALGKGQADQGYKALEHLRNVGMIQTKNAKANMRRMGYETEGMDDEPQMMRRGLELLMLCFAVGKLPEKVYEVSAIWRRLVQRSREDEEAAIALTLEEGRLAQRMGVNNWFASQSEDDLREMLQFMPDFVQRTTT